MLTSSLARKRRAARGSETGPAGKSPTSEMLPSPSCCRSHPAAASESACR